jgi:RHS repeat-associated protein
VDGTGNIYIAGVLANTVWKVDTMGNINPIAGNGTAGYTGDHGPALSAELNNPYAVAVDASGDVYIADTNNNAVRMVDPLGTITTIAGNGTPGFQGDGEVSTAGSGSELAAPFGLALDSAGNLYIADQYNDRIRKIDASTSIITTVVGGGTQGYIGDGGPATSIGMEWAEGVAIDSAGNIYFSDKNDQRVRMMNASTGIVTTIAGNGTQGFSGDDGPATSAELQYPAGIALDPSGHVYFADTTNNRIRAIGLQVKPAITWRTPAPITYGTALSATQLNATASVAGTFAYTPAAGTIPAAGTDTLSVTFTPTDTTDYKTATQTVVLTVSGTIPVITGLSPASGSAGTIVTITGANFGTTGTVTFNGIAATPASWSANSIVVTVPSGATTGNVVVTTGGGSSSGTATFTVMVYDSGTVTLTVAGVSASTAFGQNSTASSVAAGLASAFSALSSPPATVTASDASLNIVAAQSGAASDLAYSVTSSWNSQNFGQSSYSADPTSGNLTGGADGTSTPGETVYSYVITPQSGTSGYAPNGNLLSYTDSLMGTWSFGYDTLNRLTSGAITSASNQNPYYCWSFDAFGNRTNESSSSQSFQTGTGTPCQPAAAATLSTDITTPNNLNQIASTNARGVTAMPQYDAAGNMQNDGLNQYLYDGEGRVCAVASPSLSGGPAVWTQYLYDADGNRVAKGTISTLSCDATTNGFTATAAYILGMSGEQMTELDADGGGNLAWVHTNIFAGGGLQATYDTNGLHFQLSDWLGSRRVQTNYAGTTEMSYQSMPFGDMLTSIPNPGCLPADNCYSEDPTEHHFTGKERDGESGNDYFGARYYASSMGRWMSPDPSGIAYGNPYNPQSLNLYSYAPSKSIGKYHCPLFGPCYKGPPLPPSCASQVATSKAAGTTALDAIGIFPGTGNIVKAVQFGAALISAGVSMFGSARACS